MYSFYLLPPGGQEIICYVKNNEHVIGYHLFIYYYNFDIVDFLRYALDGTWIKYHLNGQKIFFADIQTQ